MNTYMIGSQLILEETLFGATLHYRVVADGREVLFRVGISHQSLKKCFAEMQKDACLWTIKDGSLTVFGDQDELSLTFCSVQGRFIQAGLALHGEELEDFRQTVKTVILYKSILLN